MSRLVNYKITFLGEAAVGKTSIVMRYSNNVFRENYLPTLGVDFVTKRFELPNRELVQFFIWDLAGQYEYKMFSPSYLKGSHYSIIVMDASDEHSWNCSERLQEHELYAEIPKNYILVVNKIDLLNKEQLESVKQRIESQYPNMKIFYTSAKENENISDVFDYITKELMN